MGAISLSTKCASRQFEAEIDVFGDCLRRLRVDVRARQVRLETLRAPRDWRIAPSPCDRPAHRTYVPSPNSRRASHDRLSDPHVRLSDQHAGARSPRQCWRAGTVGAPPRPPYVTSCVNACLKVYSRSGNSSGLVDELCGLQVGEAALHGVNIGVGDFAEQSSCEILADHRCGLQQPLVFGPEPVDARRKYRLHGYRQRDGGERRAKR